jgi:hypothetical protein
MERFETLDKRLAPDKFRIACLEKLHNEIRGDRPYISGHTSLYPVQVNARRAGALIGPLPLESIGNGGCPGFDAS